MSHFLYIYVIETLNQNDRIHLHDCQDHMLQNLLNVQSYLYLYTKCNFDVCLKLHKHTCDARIKEIIKEKCFPISCGKCTPIVIIRDVGLYWCINTGNISYYTLKRTEIGQISFDF